MDAPVEQQAVCVVGAGPAGLAAAHICRQHGFAVTVYEAADRVGGMWRHDRGEFGDKCSPEMRTNLSRYTVAFSDLAWTSIVVIGGGISGSEAASQAASQISNAKHSPGGMTPSHADSRVFHVINRPFYCLPRYLPQDPQTHDGHFKPAPRFLPLDLILYNLSRRGHGDISAAISTVPPEKAKKGHDFLRSSIGCHHADVGFSELAYTATQTQHPGYTGITDTYMEFVRSGIIVPVRGWVEHVEQAANGDCLEISLGQYEPWFHGPGAKAMGESRLSDVVGIIEATGYKADLDWLDARVQSLLADGSDNPNPRIPYILSRGSVFSQQIPTIGFVGFYEGPYWGMMEMQARLLAQRWAKREPEQSATLSSALYTYDDTRHMQNAMGQRSLQVPQFWMADYVGLMEEFARETGVSRDDTLFGSQSGPAFPSRYRHTDSSLQAKAVVSEVAGILEASQEHARFVAAAVFTGMQGVWKMTRKIDSRTQTPGGTFVGTAHFHPRQSTDAATYASEYLYIEQGTFTMDAGLSFPATRRYVYRYNETSDEITAWFVEDDEKSVGKLFNTWRFHASDDQAGGWMATGCHWCDPDTYQNDCEFKFCGAKIDRFMIRYKVDGPKKDYLHESWYQRPKVDGGANECG
ncbi:hypothetical protein J4E89_008380 [Alternaria sp. Ai002NY15]|nr:hypothetical protein J4E89_008380 [Alternaria sp. Ai002NY15]